MVSKNIVYNCDCLEHMREIPDNYYDLSIADPPYGIGESGGDKKRTRKNHNYNKVVIHEKKAWDDKTPNQEYFDELKRVSMNQVIFGANYFIDKIKTPSMGWAVWHKQIGGDFSDCELIYSSFRKALKLFSYSYHGDTRGGHDRIHPTQKPVALYKWLLQNYAKPGQTIFDSHIGSGSIRIACHDLGFDLIGCELDLDYFEAQEKRFQNHIAQAELFGKDEIQGLIYDN